MSRSLGIVILGLSVTSSWGNGHATTWRGLMRALHRRGHQVLFLERDAPWYAQNRDLPDPPYGRTVLYRHPDELRDRFTETVRHADAVIVGSYVPDGVAVARWVTETATGVTAFYDIDTPVTLDAVQRDACAYMDRALIPRFDLYLSFTGGPTLARLEREFGARRARALYCSVDPDEYFPEPVPEYWDLGFLGTYAPDRQPVVERLFMEPARHWSEGRFVAAGPQFPPELRWPENVERVEHLPPRDHRRFYSAQRFTLNATRAAMTRLGWSPSVRLFEAAACGTPIISDRWAGIEEVLTPGREVLVADATGEVINWLTGMEPERRIALGENGRRRILASHTAEHRAEELEGHLRGARRG
jgi:spore maturation protein CgeB